MSVDQAREEWQAAGDYDSACRLIRAQAARIGQLERDLEQRIEQVERISEGWAIADKQLEAALKDLAADRALADQAANLIKGEAVGIEWKRECTAFLVAHRKARGL